MTLDEQVRQALDAVASRLRADLGRHLDEVAGDLSRSLEAAKQTAIQSATEAAQRSAVRQIEEARAEARRDAEEARNKATQEIEQARATAARDAEQRLTERFETERTAAVAQAALDATAAAERAAAEHLRATETSLTERLTGDFQRERESLYAERTTAVEVAVKEATEATEKSVTERLRTAFESEKATAVALAVQDAWVKADQEHSAKAAARIEEIESRAQAQVSEAESRARTAVADAEARVAEAESKVANAEARLVEAEAKARADLALADTQASARLLAVIQKIDEGQSLTDILGSLANGAAVEARRAGVFIVEGSGVRSWRLAGFGELDREGVIQPTESNGGIILDALREANVVRETEEADGRSAIAVPLVISGRVIAVLYADQGAAGEAGQDAPAPRPNWTASIEILGRHAGRALEAMTATRLAQAAAGTRSSQPARAQTAAS